MRQVKITIEVDETCIAFGTDLCTFVDQTSKLIMYNMGPECARATSGPLYESIGPKVGKQVGKWTVTLLFLLTAFLSGASCAAQTPPDAPAPHLGRAEYALLGADVASRALDTYSTRWFLTAPCKCNHEQILPRFIVESSPRLALYEASSVGVDYLFARELMRRHRPKLARLVLIVDAAQIAPMAIHNLTLKH